MMTEKVESPTTGMTADEILKSRGEPVVPDIPQANASPGTPGPSAGTAPAPQASPEVSKGRSDRGRQLLGYILIAIGAAVMFRKYVPNFVWTFPFRLIGQAWPVLIILAGIAIIFGAVRGR